MAKRENRVILEIRSWPEDAEKLTAFDFGTRYGRHCLLGAQSLCLHLAAVRIPLILVLDPPVVVGSLEVDSENIRQLARVPVKNCYKFV